MIPDGDANCVVLAARLADRHPAVAHGLRAILRRHGVAVRLLDTTRDIWARDFCPVQVADRAFVQFRYDPDYLRGHAHLKTGAAGLRPLRPLGRCRRTGIVLDGGNVIGSPTRAVVTDKVFRDNPHVRPADLLATLLRLLDVEHVVVIPSEPGDLFGHADGMVRFIDDSTVLVNRYAGVDRRFGDRLRAVLRAHGLNVEELPYVVEDRMSDGVPSAVGCYINYLQTAAVLIVPAFGLRQDEPARRILQQLFPDTPVVPLRCETLAKEGGVLRCVSWTVRTAPKMSGIRTENASDWANPFADRLTEPAAISVKFTFEDDVGTETGFIQLPGVFQSVLAPPVQVWAGAGGAAKAATITARRPVRPMVAPWFWRSAPTPHC